MVLPRVLSSDFTVAKDAKENMSYRQKKIDKEHYSSLCRALVEALIRTSLVSINDVIIPNKDIG